LTILHTNDIHGRQERIGQIATLVRDIKATTDHPVLAWPSATTFP
jgi:2',3'-cyclic-nucleotide 2'-phosphodiesterase (5'-nucleotidase family)